MGDNFLDPHLYLIIPSFLISASSNTTFSILNATLALKKIISLIYREQINSGVCKLLSYLFLVKIHTKGFDKDGKKVTEVTVSKQCG